MKQMKAYSTFAAYLADQRPANQAVIRALRRLVARVRPELTESVKWGNGCWIGEDGPVAYVYSDADHVQFGFFLGSSLEDPKGLLEGKGRYVRHIKVRAPGDIDPRAFASLLRGAAGIGRARLAAAAKKPRSSKPSKKPKGSKLTKASRSATRRGATPRTRR
jgi:hypothetical protein